jgi:hypothetical protein
MAARKGHLADVNTSITLHFRKLKVWSLPKLESIQTRTKTDRFLSGEFCEPVVESLHEGVLRVVDVRRE